MLTIFRELLEDGPEKGGCCGPKYKYATRIHIINAKGLEKQDISGGKNYVTYYQHNQMITDLSGRN